MLKPHEQITKHNHKFKSTTLIKLNYKLKEHNYKTGKHNSN